TCRSSPWSSSDARARLLAAAERLVAERAHAIGDRKTRAIRLARLVVAVRIAVRLAHGTGEAGAAVARLGAERIRAELRRRARVAIGERRAIAVAHLEQRHVG